MKRYAEKKRKEQASKYDIHSAGRSGAASAAAAAAATADTHFQQTNGPISNSMHSD